MEIHLRDIGKKFNRDWVFRHVNVQFTTGECWSVLGPNGSGKSTLLHLISGRLIPSSGTIEYRLDEKPVDPEKVYTCISMCTPHMELIEEYTIEEMFAFHTAFKPMIKGVDFREFAEMLNIGNVGRKRIRYYSSGMKQRLKLCMSILSDVPVLLLDEPCSNLDQQGIHWFQMLLKQTMNGRIVIVCSNNREEETVFSTNCLFVNDYK